jgi:glycosyltransferase involved in cell wall biosynthesis
MLNPRAFRWTALAEEFARRGVGVKVVCSWQPGLPRKERVQAVEIHRVGNRFFERSRALLGHLKRNDHLSGAASSLGRGGAALGKAAGWLWQGIAWPDTTCVWYAPARRKAAALLRERPGCAVVTVSPSFTAALVGYAVTRKRMGVPWVMDMGDPFSIAEGSPPNNVRLYKNLNRKAELAVFRCASYVTFTNPKILHRYAAMYPEVEKKMRVIPPLVNDSDTSRKIRPKETRRKQTCIRIVYSGSLYRRLRRPEYLLLLFEGLVKMDVLPLLELHFIGNIEECLEAFPPFTRRFGSAIRVHGLVSREEAQAAVREADVVVNLGNQSDCQLPSKLVEYAAAGKPILNIIRNYEDTSKEFMKDYVAILNLHDLDGAPSEKEIRIAADFIRKVVFGDWEETVRGAWIGQFRTPIIAEKYAPLLFTPDIQHG